MEWWTYGLSDFLMFSPRVHARLVMGYNEALWPAQLAALAAGAALLAWTLRPSRRPLAPALLLAAAWAVTGWAFHWTRYADIFLAAPWLAAACGVQVLLLAAAALLAPADRPPAAPALRRSGAVLVLVAVLLVPLATALAGADWRQAEVFALMPDPTALATLGWLLAAGALRPAVRAGLAVLPALSLLLGLLTRIALAQ